jgi:hypothetical protein
MTEVVTFQNLSLKDKFIALAAAGLFYVWDWHLLYKMTHGDWLTRKTLAAEWLKTRRVLRKTGKGAYR